MILMGHEPDRDRQENLLYPAKAWAVTARSRWNHLSPSLLVGQWTCHVACSVSSTRQGDSEREATVLPPLLSMAGCCHMNVGKLGATADIPPPSCDTGKSRNRRLSFLSFLKLPLAGFWPSFSIDAYLCPQG